MCFSFSFLCWLFNTGICGWATGAHLGSHTIPQLCNSFLARGIVFFHRFYYFGVLGKTAWSILKINQLTRVTPKRENQHFFAPLLLGLFHDIITCFQNTNSLPQSNTSKPTVKVTIPSMLSVCLSNCCVWCRTGGSMWTRCISTEMESRLRYWKPRWVSEMMTCVDVWRHLLALFLN